VITNIEVDHVDFYPGGVAEIEAAFTAFAERCEHLVVCADDPGAVRVAAAAGVPTTSYGTSADADLRVEMSSAGPGGARARIGSAAKTCQLHLTVDGAHNVRNAAAAIAVAARLGVPMTTSCEALQVFRGVHRRFELRGRARGADFYDDYGHVPTELAVTLEVARRREPGRLVAVFQPHRYTRTQALWRELGASLLEADVLVVTDVYGAAQEPIPGVTGKLVVDGISQAGGRGRVVYLPHRGDVVAFLDQEVRAGDLVITMGCGDVWMLGDAAVERIGDGA